MESMPPLREIVTFDAYHRDRYGIQEWRDRRRHVHELAVASSEDWVAGRLTRGDTSLVDAWQYRERDCLVWNFRNWRYEGCVAIPEFQVVGLDALRPDDVDVHGGIEIVTEAGWIGFHTGHDGDVTVDPDGNALPGGKARHVFERAKTTRWTPRRAVAETEHLVDALLEQGTREGWLDDPVPQRPGANAPSHTDDPLLSPEH